MSREAECRVLLIGMMRSGKTTVGKLLAKETGWPLIDNDELVRQAFGATPKQIEATGGEAALREAEATALARGLATSPPAIIGVAAGTILDEGSRERLRDGGIVAWLRGSPASLAERADDAEHRPWVEAGGLAWFEAAVAERDPLYASVADITLETDGTPPHELAGDLLEQLRRLKACWPGDGDD